MACVLAARGQWATGLASGDGNELMLADRHHASVEAALMVFLFGGHDLLLLAHRAVPGVGKLEGQVWPGKEESFGATGQSWA